MNFQSLKPAGIATMLTFFLATVANSSLLYDSWLPQHGNDFGTGFVNESLGPLANLSLLWSRPHVLAPDVSLLPVRVKSSGGTVLFTYLGHSCTLSALDSKTGKELAEIQLVPCKGKIHDELSLDRITWLEEQETVLLLGYNVFGKDSSVPLVLAGANYNSSTSEFKQIATTSFDALGTYMCHILSNDRTKMHYISASLNGKTLWSIIDLQNVSDSEGYPILYSESIGRGNPGYEGDCTLALAGPPGEDPSTSLLLAFETRAEIGGVFLLNTDDRTHHSLDEPSIRNTTSCEPQSSLRVGQIMSTAGRGGSSQTFAMYFYCNLQKSKVKSAYFGTVALHVTQKGNVTVLWSKTWVDTPVPTEQMHTYDVILRWANPAMATDSKSIWLFKPCKGGPSSGTGQSSAPVTFCPLQVDIRTGNELQHSLVLPIQYSYPINLIVFNDWIVGKCFFVTAHYGYWQYNLVVWNRHSGQQLKLDPTVNGHLKRIRLSYLNRTLYATITPEGKSTPRPYAFQFISAATPAPPDHPEASSSFSSSSEDSSSAHTSGSSPIPSSLSPGSMTIDQGGEFKTWEIVLLVTLGGIGVLTLIGCLVYYCIRTRLKRDVRESIVGLMNDAEGVPASTGNRYQQKKNQSIKTASTHNDYSAIESRSVENHLKNGSFNTMTFQTADTVSVQDD